MITVITYGLNQWFSKLTSHQKDLGNIFFFRSIYLREGVSEREKEQGAGQRDWERQSPH